MYMNQIELLNQHQDIEKQQNEENKNKFMEFLQAELDKKKKLEEKVKEAEATNADLFKNRNDL